MFYRSSFVLFHLAIVLSVLYLRILINQLVSSNSSCSYNRANKVTINSDLIYINDILNENGEISQNLILDKLKYKNNWISEFICLKKAIPNEWHHTLQAQNSIKSVVNFQKDKFIVNGQCIDPSQLSNKYFYNEYINVKKFETNRYKYMVNVLVYK